MDDDKPKYLRYEKPDAHPTGTLRGDSVEGLHERTMGVIHEQANAESAPITVAVIRAMIKQLKGSNMIRAGETVCVHGHRPFECRICNVTWVRRGRGTTVR